MGTLVFQATLGGAVNIIGPNIASTINFTLPSADGTSGQTWTTNGSGVLSFGTLGIAGGGTGQITATAAFNALAPSQTGNSGKYLTTDGTNSSWATNPLGTVTSVAATVPSFLSIAGSPITTSGTLAFTLSGTALPTTSGGTGLTSFTSGGVVYASSSSVLATGSALTFDGSKLGLGITPGTNILFTLRTATQTDAAFVADNGVNTGFRVQFAANLTSIGNDFNQPLAFLQNNTEQMRLTSTGLGIGTSSPALPLDVVSNSSANAISIRGRSADDIGTLGFYTNAGSNIAQIQLRSDEMRFLSGSTRSQTFYLNGTEKMRLDSSGNLGLGVTPSAWATAYKVLQVGSPSGAFLAGSTDTNALTLGYNTFNNSSRDWKYINTAAASYYQQSAGSHYWYIAPSGTAGTTATFTQALTLNASGNLLLGQTAGVGANGGKMEVYVSDNFNGAPNLALNTGANNTGGIYLYFTNAAGTKIGSVTQASTSGVLYNVTSDKRLKNDLGVVSNTNVIANTVIHDFAWKEDGIKERGVFAQEAVNVLPSAVCVGDNNEEVTNPWAVDYSKYVPDIIVELQSLRARIAELEAK